jgi:hypothetical protein
MRTQQLDPSLSTVFRSSAAIRAGLISAGTLRGSGFQRILPDVYAPASLSVDFALRSRAAYLWANGRGVLTGYSAAELHAVPCAARDTPPELTLPGKRAQRGGDVLVRQVELRPGEHCRFDGVALTTGLRTAYDLARQPNLVEAVVAVDALSGRFGFAPSALAELADRYPGARGRRRLPGVIQLADAGAASPMESRLRLLLVLGGLPAPRVQYPVSDERAQVFAWLDLAYPDHLVAVEYDGRDHFVGRQVVRDSYRSTRLAELGWRVYRYFAGDVYRYPHRILTEVGRALRSPALSFC